MIIIISTHAPLAGRDIMDWFGDTFFIISTHAPLAGRDLRKRVFNLRDRDNFNPRAPCGARHNRNITSLHIGNISTHAPLAGRDQFSESSRIAVEISTHAPLAGRDAQKFSVSIHTEISTHAPLAGRDWRGGAMVARHALFQPTRPLRGATLLPVVRGWRV